MGKAARWFRGLLGLKKEGLQTHSAAKPPKRRWSFGKTNGEKYRTASKPAADDGRSIYSAAGDATGGGDPSKHAIAVAEAAVTAERKAADVVRLSSSGRCNASNGAPPSYVSQEWAAVKMQAHFRGYLARRALRALKGLVKLQALVRGHIVRKQTADMLRRMQALLRAQARARAGRAHISESPSSSAKSSQFCNPGPATPEKFEQAIRLKTTRRDQSPVLKRNGSKSTSWMSIGQDKAQNGGSWLDSKMEFDQKGRPSKIGLTDDEKSDKILEVDTGKSHLTSRRKNFVHSNHLGFASDQCSHSFSTSKDSTTLQTLPSPSSYELRSCSPLKANQDIDESPFCTANNSPQFYSASSRGGSARRSPFTPTKSDGLKSYLSGCSDHPNYMACTESSKAKIRSLSAPKQRPQIERSFSTKRYLVYNYDESRLSSQRVSAMHANFVNKAYPGSGRLDRLGMPLLSDGQWNRY